MSGQTSTKKLRENVCPCKSWIMRPFFLVETNTIKASDYSYKRRMIFFSNVKINNKKWVIYFFYNLFSFLLDEWKVLLNLE